MRKIHKWSNMRSISIIIGIICMVLLFDISSVSAESESTKGSADMIPFYWMLFIVGGCIAITLSYVSWRKYKAEKKKDSEEKQNKDKMID
ncbi:hypothetical protein GMD78_02550 [Ornithinibacillus sp. L9]|uniref:Sporulation protein YpjB n=1 Tax=Ornithinibacillus caprae TaxID=2678566 RepID=A0A6N8FC89_9BACI|nr:sporulation protein YpjB [Ornithinibacillus caprae]MUK87282.1 hypothetical protein [Ornithinibacillus caprae]